MRKFLAFSLILATLSGAGLYLYERYVGFARSELAARFPPDTYAFLSVSHLRKAIFAIHRDEQLRALIGTAQAIAFSLQQSAETEAFGNANTELDSQLLVDLEKHFKTQLAIGLIPNADPRIDFPDLVLATHFYGEATSFERTMASFARAYSSDSRQYVWTKKQWNGATLHVLPLFPESATLDTITIPPIDVAWAIEEEILYVASNEEALKAAIRRHHELPEKASLAHDQALAELPEYLAGADFIALTRLGSCLDLAIKLTEKRIQQSASPLKSLSLPILIDELGLASIESLTFASDFSDPKPIYIGARYTERKGLWTVLHPQAELPTYASPNLPQQASETLSANFGEAVLAIKNAFLKAAPLANIPYFALRAKILSESGVDLELALRNSFTNELIALQTIDIGTARDPRGAIVEQVFADHAIRVPLQSDAPFRTLWESQMPVLRLLFPETSHTQIDESGHTFYLQSDPNPTVTGGRLAVRTSDSHLVIGYGTLKAFNELAKERAPIPSYSDEASPTARIGTGYLRLHNLPGDLRRLTTVFHSQHNPTQPLPLEFHEFDWASLAEVELERDSVSIDDGQGHAYRLSRQR